MSKWSTAAWITLAVVLFVGLVAAGLWLLPTQPVCLAGHNVPGRCSRMRHHGFGKHGYYSIEHYDCMQFVCDRWQAEAPEEDK